MPKQIKLALIVAKPSHLWEGVQSLLRTLPEIEIIAEIKCPAVLLKMSSEMQPDLILLDASLFGEDIWKAMTKISEEWPHTQCVVLVEDSQHHQAVYDAGADLVVPQGFPATKLVAAIEELLSTHTEVIHGHTICSHAKSQVGRAQPPFVSARRRRLRRLRVRPRR